MSPVAVLTRPVDSCADLASALKTMGFTPVVAPMTRIISGQIPENFDLSNRVLIFTSLNAVKVFSNLSPLRNNVVLSVGDQTAQAARSCGFTNVVSTGGHGEDLIAHILTHYDPAHVPPMTHVCGAHLALPLEERLGENGYDINKISIYSAEKTEALTPGLCTALGRNDPVHVLFFSARAAQNFESLVVQDGLGAELAQTLALCLSARVADALDQALWGDIFVSRKPDRTGMLDLAGFLYRRSCAKAPPPA